MKRTYVVDGAIENLEDDDNLVTGSSNDLGGWLVLYSMTNDFPRLISFDSWIATIKHP